MSGIKYILRNECTSPALITYQNYSNQLWQYQVEFLPGQTRTIWATEGTLSYDLTRTCIKVLSKTIYPPTTTPTPSNPAANVSYKNQTLIHVSTMPTSDNWEFTVLNWENATITGPVDLGFSSDNWYLNDLYDSLNGWLLVFFNNSNDNKKVYFVDKNGSIKYVYTANMNSYNYDTNSNRFAYFIDRNNYKFIFTDFSSVIVYDIPTNVTDFYVDYNYDDGNLEGIIVYQEVNNYSEFILFKSSGYLTIYNFNNNDSYVDSIVYYKSNFFAIQVYSNYDEVYSFINIYNKNGALINSINLEYNNPTSINNYTLNNNTITNSITGTFNVTQSSTNGSGSGTTFQIAFNGGVVSYFNIGGRGVGYSVGDVITIDGSQFGGSSGADNVTFTVNSLGNFQYYYNDINFFGNGKLASIYWTNDNNIPWYIVIYDGIENQFYTTYHDRGTYLNTYYDYFQYSDYQYDDSSNVTPSEDFHINFNDDDGGWNGDLYSVDDCDIVSWYNSTKEFSVYEFANNAGYDYYISTYYYYQGNSLILYSNRDDSYIHYEIFQPTGHTTVDVVLTNSLDGWNLNDGWCGDAYLSQFYFLGSNEYLYTLYRYDGTLIDSLYNPGGSTNWTTEYNSFYLVNDDSQLAYYWNSSMNSIQSTLYLDSWNTSNDYYTTSNVNNGNIFTLNYINFQSIIYTKNSKSVTRTIPYIGPYLNYRIGRQIASVLTNNNSGKIVVRVYDLNFNLLNTVTTNETDYENFAMQDNRIFLTTYSGSNYIHYLITASTFKKVVTSDYYDSWSYNDWN